MFSLNAVGISVSPVAEISNFCYPPRTQTYGLSVGLQNLETKNKTVHLITLKMHRWATSKQEANLWYIHTGPMT